MILFLETQGMIPSSEVLDRIFSLGARGMIDCLVLVEMTSFLVRLEMIDSLATDSLFIEPSWRVLDSEYRAAALWSRLSVPY